MPKRPCYVRVGDFVRVLGTDNVFGYVSGIDDEPYMPKYYVEVDIGVNNDPIYLYDDELEVLNITSE